jgi:hypothetical protein
MYSSTLSVTSALDRDGRLAALLREKRPGTHYIEGSVGSRFGLDGCGESRPPPPPGHEPRTVPPVASRYTGCAIPAPYTRWIFETCTCGGKYETAEARDIARSSREAGVNEGVSSSTTFVWRPVRRWSSDWIPASTTLKKNVQRTCNQLHVRRKPNGDVGQCL